MYSMKFGADLKNSVVPEWAPGYIAYDALKAQIKAISGAEADERDALEETFFATLEEELEKVNRFYLQKIGEFDAALAALEARKPRSASGDALGTPATSDHRRNAINLHAQIGQLQAFVDRRFRPSAINPDGPGSPQGSADGTFLISRQ